MERLSNYIKTAQGVRIILEEALVNSEESDDMVSIGGKRGPVMRKNVAMDLVVELKAQEGESDQTILLERVKNYDYPMLICERGSYLYAFQKAINSLQED